ncbi:MAG: ATP synthase subunit C [Candidatus Poribacteria bacterium]
MIKLRSMIKWIKMSNFALLAISIAIGLATLLWVDIDLGLNKAFAQESTGEVHSTSAGGEKSSSNVMGMGLLAAALSTGFSAIAAGIAVAMVGSAAMGAVAERPEVMGRSIIFVGLAEGIAIYGLIISIMILGKL